MYHIIPVCIITMLYEVQSTGRAAVLFVGALMEDAVYDAASAMGQGQTGTLRNVMR